MTQVTSPGFERGNVYYVRFDNSVGAEMAVGRPVVIISADSLNENPQNGTLIAAYLTTSMQANRPISVEVNTGYKRSWVLCKQLVTLDKQRFGDYKCTLSDDEMKRVDQGIAYALGLNIDNDDNELLSRENTDLKAQLDAKEVECKVLQRAYDKVLDRMVEERIERDLSKRTAPAEDKKEESPKVVPEKETQDEPELLDINKCSFDEMRAVGITTNLSLNIIAGRPYLKKDDLRIVPGMTRIAYQLIEKKVTVGDTAEYRKKPKPVEPEVKKVNINTADWKELVEVAGMGKHEAYPITGYRKKNGQYKSVDELSQVPRFGEARLDKYRDKLTV